MFNGMPCLLSSFIAGIQEMPFVFTIGIFTNMFFEKFAILLACSIIKLFSSSTTSKETGFYKIWVNGKLKYEYNGAITGGKENYFKFGIYQTKVSVWPMYHSQTPYPTQVVYYDEVRAGKTKESVTKFLKK